MSPIRSRGLMRALVKRDDSSSSFAVLSSCALPPLFCEEQPKIFLSSNYYDETRELVVVSVVRSRFFYPCCGRPNEDAKERESSSSC